MQAKFNELVAYGVIAAIAVAGFIYSNYVQHQTEQKFCRIVNTVVESYESSPKPTTTLGAALREDYRLLKQDLRC